MRLPLKAPRTYILQKWYNSLIKGKEREIWIPTPWFNAGMKPVVGVLQTWAHLILITPPPGVSAVITLLYGRDNWGAASLSNLPWATALAADAGCEPRHSALGAACLMAAEEAKQDKKRSSRRINRYPLWSTCHQASKRQAKTLGVSFGPQINTMREALFLFPFYWWRDWGISRASNSLKVTSF